MLMNSEGETASKKVNLSGVSIDLLDVGVLVLDSQLCVLEWNCWLSGSSSIASVDALGKPITELFPDAINGRLKQAITHALESQLSSTLSSAINRHALPLSKFDGVSGKNIPVAQALTIKPVAFGDEPCCLISIYDVTETVKRERILREKSNQLQTLASDLEVSEQRTRCIIESSLDSVVAFNPAGAILSMNSAAIALFGRDINSIKSSSIYELLPCLEIARAESGFNSRAIETLGDWPKMKANHGDGSKIPVECSVSVIETGNEIFFTAVVHDLTERQAVEEKLKHLAQFDSLTNLANRSLFTETLNAVISDAKNGQSISALILLDLDRFKSVNDTMGHEAGDDLLRQVSARLNGCVRDDDLVARLGGDEFAIILCRVDGGNRGGASLSESDAIQDVVTRAVQRVIDVFSNPFNLHSRDVHVSASVGVAMCDASVISSERLTKSADIAMYAAKGEGRNNYQFYTDHLEKISEVKLSLESSLHQALKNRELALHYQPQFNRLNGRVCGVEVLLRWCHPTRGDISPEVFIPLLEEAGLIIPVGEWILTEACRQRKNWADSGLLANDCSMAVNVSARQFDHRLVECVANSITEAGIQPEMLEIELTESTLMEKTEETGSVLSELHKLGVGISIDDFGTGYSSLSYLKNFPFTSLKIDKSFVIDITDNKSSSSIAEAVIGLAHTMGLTVIAEGVETSQALRVLSQYRCDVFQGFFFARPMCSDDFRAFIIRQNQSSGLPMESISS